MAKSKIAKRISPGLTIEPDMKNVPYGHHFPKWYHEQVTVMRIIWSKKYYLSSYDIKN